MHFSTRSKYRFGEESEFNWKDLFPTNSGFVATPDDEGFNRVSGPRLRRSVDPSHNWYPVISLTPPSLIARNERWSTFAFDRERQFENCIHRFCSTFIKSNVSFVLSTKMIDDRINFSTRENLIWKEICVAVIFFLKKIKSRAPVISFLFLFIIRHHQSHLDRKWNLEDEGGDFGQGNRNRRPIRRLLK